MTVKSALPILVALAITGYGALLRLDAVTERYGPVERPAFARTLTHQAPLWASHVKPASHQWTRVAAPYIGGDPINYIRFAREMRSFYQAHVREPIFLTTTRGFLGLLDDQDIAVSFASAFGSAAAIFATYLLAAALMSPIAGWAAALLVAGEYDLITWGADGWRDDTFMATVVLTIWAFVRLRQEPTMGRALLLGFLAGICCLTRITALSFIAPGFLVLAWDVVRRRPAASLRLFAVAAAIGAAVVTPYLVSCALATGDPFFAINYHTGYYRFGEGLPSAKPMSASSYIVQKFAGHPVRVFDTAFLGLTTQPFFNKFHGFEGYLPHMGAVVATCAAAGLALLMFAASGRLVLLLLITSLLPYAFTWNVAGGGEWRFNMHVYPLFLIAAVYAIDRLAAAGVRLRQRETVRVDRTLLVRAAAFGAAVIAGTVLYTALPWFVVREAIAEGEDISVETGDRDRLFYPGGWSAPHQQNLWVRVSRDARATVSFPLPERRDYDLVLRMDPVAPERQRRATILVNRQLFGGVDFRIDPQRIGSYRLHLPERLVRAGSNEVTVIPDVLVPANEAGPDFSWLDPADHLGVRFAYFRVLAPPRP